MPKGPLGFFRFTTLGPFTKESSAYSQEINSQEQMTNAIAEAAAEVDADTEDPSPEEFQEVIDIIAQETFPESERKRARFKDCIDSEWATSYVEGVGDSVNDEMGDTPFEELSRAAISCAGMTQSTTIG